MKNLLILTVLFLLLSCQSKISIAEQTIAYKGELSGYKYDEHTVSLKKVDVITATLNSSVINVIIYSPINVTLEMGEPIAITQSEDYVFRVLLPRAFARRNDTHRYHLKINIETKIDAKTGKASGNLIKNNPSASNNLSVLARPQRNIEIKIDPKTGKASGNLFKRDPIVSNNPTVKVGKTLSGKIDFSKNKKNGLSVKSGQQVSGKVTKSN